MNRPPNITWISFPTAVLTVCLPLGWATAQEEVLTSENLAAWREHLLPAESDLVWQKIPWLTTLADGVVAANAADRPLLLWVMNGHPFGCT